MGQLARGSLGPSAAADTLRDAATIADADAAECLKTIARIDAEYGEVFRQAAYISGKYLGPYQHLLSTRDRLARARELAPRLRSLAERHDRRAARRRPVAGVLIGRPDIAALKEFGDTERLLRALRHKDDEICVHAVVALADLHVTEVVDPLLAILEGTRPGGGTPSKELREAAVGALSAFAEPRVADALVRYAREHLRDYQDTTALAGLVGMKDGRVVDLLAAHLRHGHLPPYAARLLADLGDPAAIPVLRDYISDLENADPVKGPSRALRDHHIETARAALARLGATRPAEPGDG